MDHHAADRKTWVPSLPPSLTYSAPFLTSIVKKLFGVSPNKIGVVLNTLISVNRLRMPKITSGMG